MDDNFRASAVRNGYQFNTNGGVYNPGKNYDHIKKLEVESAIMYTQPVFNSEERPSVKIKIRGIGVLFSGRYSSELSFN